MSTRANAQPHPTASAIVNLAAGQPRKRHRTWLGTVVVWSALIFALLLLTVMVILPRAWGLVPLTVLSGSMEPEIPVGSQIFSKPITDVTETRALQIGDVITFMPYANDNTLVTHRIVNISAVSDGTRDFIVKGDANGAPDPESVQERMIRATMNYHVPYVGYASQVFSTSQKSAGIWILGGSLVAGGLVYLGMTGRQIMRQRALKSST